MTPERWEEVGKLFQAALALPPDERETFLNEACGEDQAMRSEVESLLAAADGAGSFLAAGAMNDAAKMILDENSLDARWQEAAVTTRCFRSWAQAGWVRSTWLKTLI